MQDVLHAATDLHVVALPHHHVATVAMMIVIAVTVTATTIATTGVTGATAIAPAAQTIVTPA